VNVAPYISELLYEHECVIIPGFGGFIVNDRPATINRINHQFSPPFRKIMFNIHLSANDGLLMNHLAQVESISYLEAKQIVLDFSKYCQEEIEAGNRISFKEIGILYKNSEDHITFEQNEQVNYNLEAFGLGSFYSPSIERESDEARIKGIVEPLISGKLKPKDRKPVVQRETFIKRRRRAGAVVLILFIVLLSIGGGFTIKEHATSYWQNYAMLIPLFSSEQTPTEPVVDNKTTRKEIPLISENLIVADEVTPLISDDATSTEETAKESKITEKDSEIKVEVTEISESPKEDRQIPTIKAQKGSYLIITGSFSEESNALKLVNQLKQSGIGAAIADTTKNGMFRVAYAAFATIEEAKEKLYALRNEQFPDAWILKKK
jgi:nucleoid DNA-binding protein